MVHLGLLLGWQQIFHHINLGEVIDGVLALSQNPDITIEELMEYYSWTRFPNRRV